MISEGSSSPENIILFAKSLTWGSWALGGFMYGHEAV